MILSELLKLLYPPSCVSCGRSILDESALCTPCENTLIDFRERPLIANRALYSSFNYGEVASDVILAAKESHDRACAKYLAERMAISFARIANELPRRSYVLVPIPSSRAADRRRGFAHTKILTSLLIKAIESRLVRERQESHEAWEVRTLDLLMPARRVSDQTLLTAPERARNMSGAFSLRTDLIRRHEQSLKPGPGIILVDDLVTTGSTMNEGMRALRSGSLEPVAMLSACVAGRFLANKIGR